MKRFALAALAPVLLSAPALAGIIQTNTTISGTIFLKNFSPQLNVQQFGTYLTTPDILTSHPLSENHTFGASISSVFADSQIGILRAGASGSEGEDPVTYPDANVSMAGSAEFYDVLHVTSSSLPAGAPVSLHLEIDLHGVLTHPSTSTDPWIDQVYSSINAQSSHDSLLLEISSRDGINNFAGEFHSVVGDTIQIYAKLTTGIRVFSTGQVRSAGASYEDTGHYYVSSENAAATVSSESTFDFTPPTPEPATTLVVLFPFLGRRMRQRVQPGSIQT